MTQNLTVEAEKVTALLDRISIQQAAELARSGNHTGAQSLLTDLIARSPHSVHALDLAARVYAQQGRFTEAREYWTRLLAADPGNASAVAGISRIDHLRSYPRWGTWVMPLCVTALIAGALLSVSMSQERTSEQERALVVAHMDANAKSEQDALGAVTQRLDALDSTTGAVQTAQGHTSIALNSLPRIEIALAEQKAEQKALERRLATMAAELRSLRQAQANAALAKHTDRLGSATERHHMKRGGIDEVH